MTVISATLILLSAIGLVMFIIGTRKQKDGGVLIILDEENKTEE